MTAEKLKQPSTTIFTGLTSEKTILPDSTLLTESIERLCPCFPHQKTICPSTEDQLLGEYVKCVTTKLITEIGYKLHSNNLRISYDTPIVLHQPEQEVWNRHINNVILPIKIPANHRVELESPGYAGVKIIPLKVKSREGPRDTKEKEEKDTLEYMKSATKSNYLSSSTTLRSTWKLINNGIQQISSKYKEDLCILNLEVGESDDDGTIMISLLITEQFLNGRSSKIASSAKKGTPRQSVTSAVPPEIDSLPLQTEQEQPDIQVDDDYVSTVDPSLSNVEDAPSFVGSSLLTGTNASRSKLLKGHSFPPMQLHYRLIPAILDPYEEKTYLTTCPYKVGPKPPNMDAWSYSFLSHESMVFEALTRADRGLRLRAWVGAHNLLSSDSELSCIHPEIIKHSIFALAEREINMVGCRWQRLSLEEYIIDLLIRIKQCFDKQFIQHFFIKDVNLLSGLTVFKMRTVATRLDLLLKKEISFKRVIDYAVSILPPSRESTQQIVEEIFVESDKVESSKFISESDQKSIKKGSSR